MLEIRISIGEESDFPEKLTAADRKKGKNIIEFPNDYIVIDTETTGLSPYYDSIIEVSALKIHNNEVIDKYSSLVQPDSYYYLDEDDKKTDFCIIDGERIYFVDDFITQLTGITNKMLESAPKSDFVIPEFINFIGDSILVGHNVNFDINFLYDNLFHLNKTHLSNDFIDTMRISRRVFPESKHHRLSDVIDLCNLEYDSSRLHRSLYDCECTNNIFKKMQSFILEKYDSLESFTQTYSNSAHHKQKLDPKLLVPQTNNFDETHPLYGKTCVFTGTLEKMVRKDAMQAVINYGGLCANNVTKSTNFLILGNNDYCKSIKDGKSNKHKKAESFKLQGQDIEIIPESIFYEMLDLI